MLFALLFSDGRRPGDTIDVRILRDGERMMVTVPLQRIQAEADKIPPYVYGHGPDYSVVGGLVFQELTVPYLTTFGDWQRRGPPRLLIAWDREAAEPSPESPRIVLLSSVLPDAANLGYEGVRNLIVERVNGRPIGSMDDLREAFSHPRGGLPRRRVPARALARAARPRRRGDEGLRGAHPRRLRCGPPRLGEPSLSRFSRPSAGRSRLNPRLSRPHHARSFPVR